MTNTDGIGPKGEEVMKHTNPQPPRTLGKDKMGRGRSFINNDKFPAKMRKTNRGR